jgi:hypothetical protein
LHTSRPDAGLVARKWEALRRPLPVVSGMNCTWRVQIRCEASGDHLEPVDGGPARGLRISRPCGLPRGSIARSKTSQTVEPFEMRERTRHRLDPIAHGREVLLDA